MEYEYHSTTVTGQAGHLQARGPEFNSRPEPAKKTARAPGSNHGSGMLTVGRLVRGVGRALQYSLPFIAEKGVKIRSLMQGRRGPL